MKRFFVGLFALAFSFAANASDLLLMGAGGPANSIAPVSITQCSNTSGNFVAGVVTFAAQALCTASTGINVVAIAAKGNAALTGVTVDGVAATLGIASRNTTPTPDKEAEIWYVARSVNLTGSVVVTSGDATSTEGVVIAVYELAGGLTGTPAVDVTQSANGQCQATSAVGLTFTVANNSGQVAGVTGSSSATSATWANATEYNDTVVNNTLGSSASVATVTGGSLTITPTCSASGSNDTAAGISFK